MVIFLSFLLTFARGHKIHDHYKWVNSRTFYGHFPWEMIIIMDKIIILNGKIHTNGHFPWETIINHHNKPLGFPLAARTGCFERDVWNSSCALR